MISTKAGVLRSEFDSQNRDTTYAESDFTPQPFTHVMPVEVQTLMLGNKKILPSRWDTLRHKGSAK
jgi:hypothetical protein